MTKKFLSIVMAISLLVIAITGVLLLKNNSNTDIKGVSIDKDLAKIKCSNDKGVYKQSTNTCLFVNGKECDLISYYEGKCTK